MFILTCTTRGHYSLRVMGGAGAAPAQGEGWEAARIPPLAGVSIPLEGGNQSNHTQWAGGLFIRLKRLWGHIGW